MSAIETQAPRPAGQVLSEPGEPLIDWITWAIGVIGLAATLTAGLVWSWALALSVGLGAALAWANLWLLRTIVRRLFAGERQASMAGLLIFKFFLLIALIFAITRWLPTDALALMVGFSSGLAAILVGSFFGPSPSAVVLRLAPETAQTPSDAQQHATAAALSQQRED